MHNLVSVFRAVENRRPVVIASNAGPSTIIDPSGRVVVRARPFAPDAISATVRVDVPAGVYRRWGDRVPLGLIACLVAASFAALRRSARTRARKDGNRALLEGERPRIACDAEW
jgi:apolipoprotein N-acyltransferase